MPPASNSESQRIYFEHCQLAEVYLKVQEEIREREQRKWVNDGIVPHINLRMSEFLCSAELNRQLERDKAELEKGRQRLEEYNRLMEEKVCQCIITDVVHVKAL